ncbi:hypothetical protein BS78_07G067400 [Paspalum vaginatum]|nr:hypothetical protein BS78_07G067400 [Paspalum vaginatum]
MGAKLAGDTTSKAAAAAKASTRAYVTFLVGDGDESWKRVVELAKGLRKVGSPYPLVVVVLPDVPEPHRRILISEGCLVREVEPVYPPENQAQHYASTYSKLRIWELVEYERVVYLDADMIQVVLENIDDLFDLDKGHLYAVANSGDKTYYVEPPVLSDNAELVPPSTLSYCSKAADVFVCKPSMATAKALLDALNVCPRTPAADLQDFLLMFFRDQYKPVLLENKLVLTMSHPDRSMPKRPWTDQTMAQFSNYWLTTAKEMLFAPARDNLPALATLAASCAAVGVISTANPVICFGFYAVFIAAMAAVTTSLRTI